MDDLKSQIINKAGFLIYTDYWEKYFSKMTGDQVKEVFRVVFHFNATFEVLKTDDLAVEMVVATIIDNIKRDATKRAKQAIASAENGKLGGRPKKDAKKKQTKSKTEANVNVNVNEECKLKLELELEKKYLFSKLPIFIDKELWKVFIDFRISIATKHKPFTEHAKELLIKDLTKFENIKTGNANIALENSIKNSWQGVFEPKNNNNNNYSPIPQTNSISSSFDEKKNFYLENRNKIHPNLNEINDILNKIDNNQSKTKIIAYKAKTAFFVSNNANANLDLDEKLEKYFDLIVVIDYKTKEKYEL